jgi:hypothetical protein
MNKLQRIYRELRKYLSKADARYAAHKLILLQEEGNLF